jgi:ABC-type transporter Mla MlaB component
MLRVSATTRPGAATIMLEGRLAGPWVDEVRACWRRLAAARDAGSIRIDLEAVTFVDPTGKALLCAMHEQGAVLVASGCMTRAIVEEIETRSRERGATVVEKGED